MFRMNFNITFFNGKNTYTVTAVESIKIVDSVDSIISTAEITLPSRPDEKLLLPGSKIDIFLWYDGFEPEKEFSGYVKECSDNGGKYTVLCENEVYLLRKQTCKNAVYNKITCKDLLTEILKDTSLKVDCDYDFDYDKFTIQNVSVYQVLKQLKSDVPCHIYLKDGVLHFHLPFTKDFGTAVYDTEVNIDRNGYALKFLTKDQRKLRVIYKGKTKDGKQIESDVKGDPDGNIVTVEYKGVTTKECLNRMAEEYTEMKMFDGVEGSFTGWLYPVCRGGYRAEMRFCGQSERNGIYYVNSVEIQFDSSGAKRRVTLSKKLS